MVRIILMKHKKEAKVIVVSKSKFKSNQVNIIKTKMRDILGKVTFKFYNYKPKNIVAVTGTNGKTSVDFYQILIKTHTCRINRDIRIKVKINL